MSIDLEWSKLDAQLAFFLVDVLNRQLASVERPSFIGPVEVTSLDFGSMPPDVELIDMRDIYRDFLEDDEDEDSGEGVKVTEGVNDEEGFEWVSRRAASRAEGFAHQYLPPHVRYGGRGMAAAGLPPGAAGADIWSAGTGTPSFAHFRPPVWGSGPHPHSPMYRSPSPSSPYRHVPLKSPSIAEKDPHISSSIADPPAAKYDSIEETEQHQEEAPPALPNVQLHLHINWHSNLRITLTTCLLINYPSPMFMSLPIKLSVTGLIFTGELAVAYEGARRRVHLCILDDLDPYGPAAGGQRLNRGSASSSSSSLASGNGSSSAPAAPHNTTNNTGTSLANPSRSNSQDHDADYDTPPHISMPIGRPAKPLPAGQRLLPSIYIESEIGQADKHVLKNVARVERFVQDVVRRTVEEELVFPNFHTLVMEDGST